MDIAGSLEDAQVLLRMLTKRDVHRIILCCVLCDIYCTVHSDRSMMVELFVFNEVRFD